MIAYKVAYEKAKELKKDIDNVMEYDNGWDFGSRDDENYDGGGHASGVILKKDGKAINMPQFVVNGTGEHIRDFDIKE